MPKVRNWQIRREMDYPYEESRPQKQFAIVFNINRCIGCQTCTMSCKSTWAFNEGQEHMWWNNVETKPYGGYPQSWDAQVLQRLGPQPWDGDTYGGKTIFEAAPPEQTTVGYLPAQREWSAPNLYEDTPAGQWAPSQSLPEHKMLMFYLQRTCNHCTYPACLAACPRKAIYKRPEDGVVLIDQKRCRGYRRCVEACPYKKSMYNPVTRTSEKCIGCYPRLSLGLSSRCVASCVGKIRLQGWVSPPDQANLDNPIDYLVHEAKVALPLYSQFGLEPNLYYIPPRWAPRSYLKQLFGPNVEQAIERYSDPDERLFGVLRLFGMTDKIIGSYAMLDRAVRAFDEQGDHLLDIDFDEPIFVRPEYDEVAGTMRFNEP